MCGVLGFYKVNDITFKLLLGLDYLQRRGYDSSGITIKEEGKPMITHRVVGQVRDLKRKVSKEEYKLFGSGIGHVRYATSGTNLERDAQPLYKTKIDNIKPSIAIAHNGEVLELEEIRRRYPEYGFSTECDLEGILAILYSNIKSSDEKDIYFAVKKVMEEVKGAYSVIALIDDKLIGFRDPKGIRPLVMTENAFASESLPLEEILKKKPVDVAPGSLVIMSDKGRKVYQIMKPNPHYCAFEYAYFADANSTISIPVRIFRKEIGKKLAEKYVKKKKVNQIITPIPNTPIPMAEGVSEKANIPRNDIISKRTDIRVFQASEENRRNSWMYYTVNDQDKNIDEIIIVDDSIVRGTNIKGVIRKIREKYDDIHIEVLLGFPPIRHPCPFGIDMKTTRELIAVNKTEEEIAKEIGANEVHYIKKEDYVEVINSIAKENGIENFNLCMGCVTGEYPGLTEEDIEKMEKRRIHERKVMGNKK